jgi:acetyl-CoA carboxylase biotin carboxyl carrier protein
MTIDFKELRELLAAIASTDITELSLKNADFELTVSKSRGVNNGEMMMMAVPTNPNPQLVVSTHQETLTVAANIATNAIADKKWVEVKSPMVGTFYRSPAPDEAAFASIGDRIRTGQTVCIIEAMKLMNEIEAEIAGQVMEVLVENGQPVEFGQTLMYINPS